MLKIASKLRELRNKKGYSQNYVSTELDISQNKYSKIERNQQAITLETVDKIAKFYEVNPLDLLESDCQFTQTNHNQSGGSAKSGIFQEQGEMVELLQSELIFVKDQLALAQAEINRLWNLIQKNKN